MGDLNLRSFPDELQHALRIAAAKRRTSIKALMVMAAREWLQREGELLKKGKQKAKG